jgi:membrane protein YqaA with SNARE-associated domain
MCYSPRVSVRGVNEVLRRLYDWTLSLAASRHALWALAGVSFIESSVFPIPPDILLIPLVLARPAQVWLIAGVCTIASVLGGAFGYFIGWGLFEQVGEPVLAFYGMTEKFGEFSASYNEYGAWAVLIAGITPFPYKVITILSGTTGLNFAVFMIASLIARGFRFFMIAALLWKFGPPIRIFIEERLGLVFSLFVAALVGGFVVMGLTH